MKVFIGGSKNICSLPDVAKAYLRYLIDIRAKILVGDCGGADCAVQRFFTSANYQNVTVYYSGEKARNSVGNHTQVNVVSDEIAGTFEYHRSKDIKMELECDIGFMIWDGISKGTLQNIIDLTAIRKRVFVCVNGIISEYSRIDVANLLLKDKSAVNIWLDDSRDAPRNFIRTRSVYETEMLIECAEKLGVKIVKIDCDHDLGQYETLGGNGFNLIDWLTEQKLFYPVNMRL